MKERRGGKIDGKGGFREDYKVLLVVYISIYQILRFFFGLLIYSFFLFYEDAVRRDLGKIGLNKEGGQKVVAKMRIQAFYQEVDVCSYRFVEFFILNEQFSRYCQNLVFLSINKYGLVFRYFLVQCFRCFEKEEIVVGFQEQEVICKGERGRGFQNRVGFSQQDRKGR